MYAGRTPMQRSCIAYRSTSISIHMYRSTCFRIEGCTIVFGAILIPCHHPALSYPPIFTVAATTHHYRHNLPLSPPPTAAATHQSPQPATDSVATPMVTTVATTPLPTTADIHHRLHCHSSPLPHTTAAIATRHCHHPPSPPHHLATAQPPSYRPTTNHHRHRHPPPSSLPPTIASGATKNH
ncbi:proline-rich extensin-like protein EPR1 [Helianthus annuus]|uniref:proline-rich extensin-like protein EPR1 n=1 Tax=Helianthus annuus TaxID=4232 RepID=UPI000B907E3F|nr:proline-rich extensin-like protein EPR1 [Helianthus annuus]